MTTYTFVREVVYTENVVVEADDLESAREAALEADGETNHDDRVRDLRLVSQS